MNKLELAWSTYEFYTLEITDHEYAHVQLVKEINETFPFLNSADKKSLQSEYDRQHKCLFTLYKKHLDSISDLISLNQTLVDVPPERKVDITSLITLKNVTATLIQEMKAYKKEIDELFG